MQGMSFQSLKKHKALIPLYVCTALGCCGAIAYTLRLALRNPDVAWSRKQGELPNEEFRSKQYKFYSPNLANAESPAPKY